MKILLIGNGGREHALAWRLAQSPRVTKLYATRPNAGLAEIATGVDLPVDDVRALMEWARDHAIDLTVVGPELPLTLGIVDLFEQANLLIWGPSEAAARLEGSKAFAKEIMVAAGVPTAAYGAFDDVDAAKAWVRSFARPVVVKADGLAAGKGVILCDTVEQADAAIEQMLVDGAFGAAGAEVVIEELLRGEEASFIALCDGQNVLPLASSQDHKRVGDGDTGPNTGGMGAYSPAPIVDEALETLVMEEVMLPTVRAMADRGTPFVGFLYAGLMIEDGAVKVLEFNVRLGDPETQPLMMRLQSDLVGVLLAGLDGRLDQVSLQWDPRSALTVVLCSEGYPASSKKGDPIEGLERAGLVPDSKVFIAGARLEGDRVLTNGGRVLGVTALGETLKDAANRAYEALSHIHWPGAHHRSDIGWRSL
jgi:phosphoribosylamine--glycine ligase